MSAFFFFSSRRRHTRFDCDWSSDVCSSDLPLFLPVDPQHLAGGGVERDHGAARADRKSTRLNSSHSQISYAVFCLKKKNIMQYNTPPIYWRFMCFLLITSFFQNSGMHC